MNKSDYIITPTVLVEIREKNLLDFRTSNISVLPVPVNGYQVKDFVITGLWPPVIL